MVREGRGRGGLLGFFFFFFFSFLPVSLFAENLLNVADCKLPRKNMLILTGPSNNGKTMLSTLITDLQLWRKVDNSKTFPFGVCVSKRMIWHDEAEINAAAAQQYKPTMGGEPTSHLEVSFYAGQTGLRCPTPLITGCTAPVRKRQRRTEASCVKHQVSSCRPLTTHDWTNSLKKLHLEVA